MDLSSLQKSIVKEMQDGAEIRFDNDNCRLEFKNQFITLIKKNTLSILLEKEIIFKQKAMIPFSMTYHLTYYGKMLNVKRSKKII